jgi:hypothetical protein
MPGTHASGFARDYETRLRAEEWLGIEWLERGQAFFELYSQSRKVIQTSYVLLILNPSDKHQFDSRADGNRRLGPRKG